MGTLYATYAAPPPPAASRAWHAQFGHDRRATRRGDREIVTESFVPVVA
jgi:hypothetical protein